MSTCQCGDAYLLSSLIAATKGILKDSLLAILFFLKQEVFSGFFSSIFFTFGVLFPKVLSSLLLKIKAARSLLYRSFWLSSGKNLFVKA